jgi:hypothetical protein
MGEQHRSRFDPQIAVPQVRHLEVFATIVFRQCGQRFIGP